MNYGLTPEQEEHPGCQFLKAIGRGHFVESEVTLKNGNTIKAQDFLGECEVHARPLIDAFYNMDSENPDRPILLEALQAIFDNHVKIA
jgi:hypothetical protein